MEKICVRVKPILSYVESVKSFNFVKESSRASEGAIDALLEEVELNYRDLTEQEKKVANDLVRLSLS